MLEDLAERVNSNSPLVHRGRWVNLTFTFGIGEDDFLITIEGGRVINIENRPLATRSGVFAIRASRETWASHWLKVPPRDYHDIWSMLPKRLATLDGDLIPLMQNLLYFKDVIASLRDATGQQEPAHA